MSAMSESSAAASTPSVAAVDVGHASPGHRSAPDGGRAGGHYRGCGDAEPTGPWTSSARLACGTSAYCHSD